MLDLRVLRATLTDTDEPAGAIHAPLGALLAEASVAGREASQSKLTRAEPLLREFHLHCLLRLLEFSLLDGQEFVALTLLQLLEDLNTLLRCQLLDVRVANCGYRVRQVEVELEW